MTRPRVLIVGGGFGGLHAARSLRRAAVDVTLLDRRNFHLFQPLLYQVATGALSPANIAAPLRSLVKRQRNCRVELADVRGFDVAGRRVLLADGDRPYDYLIVATGVRHNYFGHDEWEPFAPGLKTVEDATRIRARILRAFESAEREPDRAAAKAWLTFVVVGAGPTGVELAGALAEIARHTLKHDFRTIDPADANILLVEASARVLPSFTERLSARAEASLAGLGVRVRCGTAVTAVGEGFVTVKSGDREETIPAHTVLWGAGVQASPLGRALAESAGAQLDRAGRVIVEPDLSLPGHPEIFVIGDLAHFAHQAGWPTLPGIAPVAMQQGSYVARLIAHRVAGVDAESAQRRPQQSGAGWGLGDSTPATQRAVVPPFHYRHRGSMATIGRKHAVAHVGRWQFGGLLAWLAWLLIHLMYLVQFQNRLLVLTQWAWNYATRNRSARLITESER
jgi:NADH dehydrogenase